MYTGAVLLSGEMKSAVPLMRGAVSSHCDLLKLVDLCPEKRGKSVLLERRTEKPWASMPSGGGLEQELSESTRAWAGSVPASGCQPERGYGEEFLSRKEFSSVMSFFQRTRKGSDQQRMKVEEEGLEVRMKEACETLVDRSEGLLKGRAQECADNM